MARIYQDNPEDEFRRLRSSGRAQLPRDAVRSRVDNRNLFKLGTSARTSMSEDVGDFFRRSEGRDLLNSRGFRALEQKNLATAGPDSIEKIQQMHRQRTAMGGGMGGAGNAQVAWPKMRDPFEQFREKAWWFLKEGEFSQSLKKVREWARLIYMTHPLIPSLIDIYSRFPLLDIEFKHEDQKLADFYNELFLDQLDYQEFLFDAAREYWTVGEFFALGSWHDGIGAWDADELLNPDDVVVSRNSVLRQYQFHLKVPEGIKKLIETRQPREEYEMLVRFYPYILQWAQQNSEIPVSDVLLKQLKFKVNPWEPHGVPLLMRGFKTLMLEMSLEAAQDAVADRLYSPLILANLGIEDVGDGEGPWIPEPEELDGLRDDLALALMSDFRLMVYHHGLKIESVFGREVMPRFDADFDRVDMKLMQIFGIGPELLQGGNSDAPYASGALNRELITQMLTTYQVALKKFLRQRIEVVAERQGHYEFEKRGGQRYPVYETVLMQNELTGEEYVEERPKLAIPEPNFRDMNLRDETVERQFLLELKQVGVPISDGVLLLNIPIEFDDQVTAVGAEKLDKVLAELHYQKRLMLAIFVNHLPVPPEYSISYMEFISGIQGMALGIPGTDITSGAPAQNLFPTDAESEGDQMKAATAMGEGEGEEDSEGPPSRSSESDEQRGGAPRKAKIISLDVLEGKGDNQIQRTQTWEVPGDFRLYATEDDKVRLAAMEQEMALPEPEREEQSEPAESVIEKRAGYEWTDEDRVPDGEIVRRSQQVAGMQTMATPHFMQLRRRMKLPEGTKVKEAKVEEVAEQATLWHEAQKAVQANIDGMEDESGVSGEGDESAD